MYIVHKSWIFLATLHLLYRINFFNTVLCSQSFHRLRQVINFFCEAKRKAALEFTDLFDSLTRVPLCICRTCRRAGMAWQCQRSTYRPTVSLPGRRCQFEAMYPTSIVCPFYYPAMAGVCHTFVTWRQQVNISVTVYITVLQVLLYSHSKVLFYLS